MDWSYPELERDSGGFDGRLGRGVGIFVEAPGEIFHLAKWKGKIDGLLWLDASSITRLGSACHSAVRITSSGGET